MAKCSFVAGASSFSSLPESIVPEIAFAGRSNVGKSTLINLLTGRAKIAKVSSNPGCTKQINFFSISNDLFRLVDLPGYGHSNASKTATYGYLKLIEYYLKKRSTLQKVILLIDSRRGLKVIDLDFIDFLEENQIYYQLVLTKIDKITQEELKIRLSNIEHDMSTAQFFIPPLVSVSSKEKQGLEELIYEITNNITK